MHGSWKCLFARILIDPVQAVETECSPSFAGVVAAATTVRESWRREVAYGSTGSLHMETSRGSPEESWLAPTASCLEASQGSCPCLPSSSDTSCEEEGTSCVEAALRFVRF